MKLNWIESKVWAWMCELARLPRGCFVKIQTIADKFGYARRRIEMCIRKFKDAGWLIVKRRGPTSSQYFVKEFKEKQLSLFSEECVSFCVSPPILSEDESERVATAREEIRLPDVSHIRSSHGRFAALNYWKSAKAWLERVMELPEGEFDRRDKLGLPI
jgi:hypothetical protein